MRVIHVITGLGDGGAEAVLYRLISSDKNDVHHVVSLTEAAKYGPLLNELGVGVTALGMPRGRITLKGIFGLWRKVREWRADVMQTWMYHSDLLGGIAGWLTGLPVVWGVHNSVLEPDRSPRTTILAAKICARLSHWIPAHVIACARAAKDVHTTLGYDAHRMTVIPNGYDLTQFRPNASERRRVRDEWSVCDNVPVIGMVARFDPYKDHTNFLTALSTLNRNGIDFQSVLVGAGVDKSNAPLTDLIAREGLGHRVRLMGQRQDIPAMMSAFDINVLSSSAEAFPNVLCEAMSCGTPCVTTDVGDAAIIVSETGWIVPPGDSTALARVIESALLEWRSKNHWKLRQQHSRQRISTEFSIETMVSRYRATWASVLRFSSQRSMPPP